MSNLSEKIWTSRTYLIVWWWFDWSKSKSFYHILIEVSDTEKEKQWDRFWYIRIIECVDCWIPEVLLTIHIIIWQIDQKQHTFGTYHCISYHNDIRLLLILMYSLTINPCVYLNLAMWSETSVIILMILHYLLITKNWDLLNNSRRFFLLFIKKKKVFFSRYNVIDKKLSTYYSLCMSCMIFSSYVWYTTAIRLLWNPTWISITFLALCCFQTSIRTWITNKTKWSNTIPFA